MTDVAGTLTGDELVHVTVQGERWDHLAMRYYGDPTAYARIVRANPELAITPMLPVGSTVRIPIVTAPTVDTTDLPPWRQ